MLYRLHPLICPVTVNASPASSLIAGTGTGKRTTTTFPVILQPIPLRPESLASFSSSADHYSIPTPPSEAAEAHRPAAETPMPPSTSKTIRNGLPHHQPRLVHSRPPLRFDRSFLEDRSNQLKLVQIFCGLIALILTVNCWPNRWAPFCVGYLWDFWQLFNAVCVHGFFLVGTAMLAVAHLFSVPDAFYHYNFPMLEKFYTALAMAMYLLASFFAVYNLVTRASLSPLWLFPVGATLAGFGAYFADFWARYRRDRDEAVKAQGRAQAAYIT